MNMASFTSVKGFVRFFSPAMRAAINFVYFVTSAMRAAVCFVLFVPSAVFNFIPPERPDPRDSKRPRPEGPGRFVTFVTTVSVQRVPVMPLHAGFLEAISILGRLKSQRFTAAIREYFSGIDLYAAILDGQ